MTATDSAAATSLKRSRDLFGFSAVPNVEDIGYERRRRAQMGVEEGDQQRSAPSLTHSTAITLKAPPPTVTTVEEDDNPASTALVSTIPPKSPAAQATSNALAVRPPALSVPNPTWHAPWKLSTVLSSHLGWLRCIAFDPSNRLMATGAGDRVIKIWDFPKASAGAADALQWTLTGHISAVRGLEFSARHPYLFSVAEDKTVKCWDLETNQVVRHYHGHLSGVYAVKLHPTLDILVTAGRDAVARVWDMRSKTQIHCLSGHEHTVTSVLTAAVHPQIITASHDATVKLWDLAAGKCFTTLTHHSKSVRGLSDAAGRERSFVSASADGTIRKWQGKNGKFLKAMRRTEEPNTRRTARSALIWNTVAVQEDGVMVTGSDDGALDFWDYDTGYCFQQSQAKVQPGSLAQSESGILCSAFDKTGTRLVTGQADKSIQIWRQDEEASAISHPIDMEGWEKTCRARALEQY